jgi:Cof subfamily protein (haloacid dehalogenase superfamily)
VESRTEAFSTVTDVTVKLIALDLDGTLLGADGSVSTRNIHAVQAIADAGHHVVIATGRPLHLVADLADQLGTAVSYIVGTNGSMIGTFPDAALVRLMGFDVALVRQVVTAIRSSLPGTGFALATDAGLAHERGFAERMPAVVDDDPVDDVLGLGGTEAYKLFAFHNDMSVAALLSAVPEHLPAGLSANHMGADAIDIGPDTIDKCSGLRWVCDELGVGAADVIAFGDEWNDLTMLEWAGRGVAMANADNRVKASADEVAPANTADGVAVVLEQLLS